MAEEKLLTVREVASYLSISEKEVVELAEKGSIPGYKVGGVYLRFKKEQVQNFKKSSNAPTPKVAILKQKYTFRDWVSDFFYFNDFYILAVILVTLLLIIIFQGY